MLINLSNHPVSQWSEKQLQESLNRFGEVVDLPFPSIQPEISSDDMRNLVKEYGHKCLKMLANDSENENSVHIMGEMVFTTALVVWLLKKNIRCIASTTVRQTENNGNIITSVFNFAGFRDYFIMEDD